MEQYNKINKSNLPKKSWFARNQVPIVVSVVIALIIVVIAFSGDNNDQNNTDSSGSSNTKSSNQATPTPKLEYKEIETFLRGTSVAEINYIYLSEGKPDINKTKSLIIEFDKNGCSRQLCEYYLWDSKEGYDNRVDNSNIADKFASDNREHLIGYLNSGDLFFYYGVAGSVEGKSTLYDRDNNTFIEI
jgi:hypothetical protein